MADLDDFFAKKDKKKKGTKKFSKANTDVIAKNLEETAKKELRAQEKLEPLATSAALNEEKKTETKIEDDDDWEVYREDKKDYTGLKIETLKVESEPEEEEGEEQMNEDGEMVTVKKEESGPWNKKAGTNNNTAEPAQQEEKTPEPDHTAPTPASTGRSSYVPPHMRGGNTSETPGGPRRPVKGRMKAAPDINSEVYFPSLSSTADDSAPKGAWGKKLEKRDEGQFEEVRERQGQTHSSRSAEAPKLILGNRFEGLRDDD